MSVSLGKLLEEDLLKRARKLHLLKTHSGTLQPKLGFRVLGV